MKKVIKKITSSILLCAVLSGCSSGGDPNQIPSEPSNCPISTLRTGTQRQGIKGIGNSFECTENGSYFMCYDGVNSWLLYADRSSDTVIKLCGRPDCTHTDSDCNAYFNFATTICYYDGFLYTLNKKDSFAITDKDLIRMNLDGTEKVSVFNTDEFAKANGYENIVSEKIFNGVLFFLAGKLDEDGETIFDCCYYKLDGSMDEPKVDAFSEMFVSADGENIIAPFYDKESNLYVYGVWEPENGTVDELFRAKDENAFGYIGTKANYYVEDGVIIEDAYTEGKKELIDTGLRGDYQLACFPDCMVMYEKYKAYKEKTLYFYDWDCNNLGSVKIDYEFNKAIAGFICGETPDRIFLTDNVFYIPCYYINKSDFGTGNIETHPFKLPEGMQSEFMEGDKLEESN